MTRTDALREVTRTRSLMDQHHAMAKYDGWEHNQRQYEAEFDAALRAAHAAANGEA